MLKVILFRSSTHSVLLGLVIKSTSQLSHCHVWKTLLDMLYIVKKNLKCQIDPPRPCQQAKIKLAFMTGQVGLQPTIQPRREAYILETSTSLEAHSLSHTRDSIKQEEETEKV